MTNMPNTTLEASKPSLPLPFRIFLASPGDCGFERRLAREVIKQLRGERRFHCCGERGGG